MPSKKRLSSLRCLYGPCNTYFVSTPIGTMQILSCTNGLHSVGQIEDPDFQPDPHAPVALTRKQFDDNGYMFKPALRCIDWLEAYFKFPKSLPDFSLPPFCQCVCSPKGLFLENVWLTLAYKVPFGTTTSYGNLAELSGRPGAAMAVGSAMRRNPFQILVPCHRVIKSNGDHGNYCGGTKNQLKNWLLDHERNLCPYEFTSENVTSVC